MALQNVLRAVSDPTRREILSLLKNGSMSAGEIGENFDISLAAVSRHLSVLKQADLVTDKRDGKYVYYRLNTSVLEEIILWINNLVEENDEKYEKENDNIMLCDPASDALWADCVE